MAYTAAEIQTAVLQSLGASISADTTKLAAITEAIKNAFIEAATIYGDDDTDHSVFNQLWFMCAMYRASVVAVGINQATMHLYNVYHDYVELLNGDKLTDATVTTDEPA